MGLLLLGVVLVAVVVTSFDDAGFTWDEPVQLGYGALALEYFRSGFEDVRCNEFFNLRFYGPLVEMVPALIAGDDPGLVLAVRHLWCGLIALLAVPGVYLLARSSGRIVAALGSVGALLVLPRFVGHAFNNSKDIPFAVATIWFVLAVVRPSGSPRRRVVGSALALGLASCVRPGGFPLLVMLGLALEVVLILEARSGWTIRDLWGRLMAWGGILVGGWIVMVLPWPWAHANPVLHPLQAMLVSARFQLTYPVLFAGDVLTAMTLPRSYLLHVLAITTPLPLLVLAGLGAVGRPRRRTPEAADGACLVRRVCLVWFLLPMGLFLVLRPPIYDGLRHFLFILPPLAVLAGLGVDQIWSVSRGRGRALVGGAALVLFLLSLRPLVQLHPYQSVYYNSLVGGVAGAEGRYELDYWAASYREALLWVADQVEGDGRVHVVGVEGPQHFDPLLRAFWTEDLVALSSNSIAAGAVRKEDVDYFIETRRAGWGDKYPAAPVAHEVSREGAMLCRVLRPGSGPVR